MELTSKLILLLKRAASKPLDVVVFRGMQELNLTWLKWSNGWKRIENRADKIIAPKARAILVSQHPIGLSKAQLASLEAYSKRIIDFDFEIFGHRVPEFDVYDFSSDWRFGHKWEKQYFKNYSFYEQKLTPYDVKMPWELSRLGFLVPVLAQMFATQVDLDKLAWVAAVLDKWDKENPLAHSVNWYPMEASMRGINLVIVSDLIKCLKRAEHSKEIQAQLENLDRSITKLLYKNALFVWKTREYTDVRGNHYTANIVCLFLAGLVLQHVVPHTKQWVTFAEKEITNEIKLQFLSDGVNFEKACGYHKLVLELFVLAAIAMENWDFSLPPDCLALLEKAANFSDAIMRPDGLSVNFGDNDDACALPFSEVPLRSHGPVVELVRAWRNKAIGTGTYSEVEATAARLFFPNVHVAIQQDSGPECLQFPDGGYYIIRDSEKGFFFVTDLGEVGMKGRGGHGHNDLLSFELLIDGQTVVLDSGCSGYTSDLKKKAWFKGTSAHSTIQLFDAELADLTGPWTIANQAVPQNVSIETSHGVSILNASHEAYSRFQPGTMVQRQFVVDPIRQKLTIHDKVRTDCEGGAIAWHFPIGKSFAAGAEAEKVYQVTIEQTKMCSELALTQSTAPFSSGYGQEFQGNVITANSQLKRGNNTFNFTFGLVTKGTI